jgi:hypothetical protein
VLENCDRVIVLEGDLTLLSHGQNAHGQITGKNSFLEHSLTSITCLEGKLTLHSGPSFVRNISVLTAVYTSKRRAVFDVLLLIAG